MQKSLDILTVGNSFSGDHALSLNKKELPILVLHFLVRKEILVLVILCAAMHRAGQEKGPKCAEFFYKKRTKVDNIVV